MLKTSLCLGQLPSSVTAAAGVGTGAPVQCLPSHPARGGGAALLSRREDPLLRAEQLSVSKHGVGY